MGKRLISLSGLVLLQLLMSLPLTAQQTALVAVDEVVRQQFNQTVPILGRLVAKQSGTVASRINGAVEQILAQVGDRVTRGQLIAVIDAEPFKLQKALAETEKKEAQARINTARAQLALANQEVKRLSGLQSSAAVSKAALDDANQQMKIAFARVSEAEAALSSSDAALRVAELELGYAKVTAPFNGTVTAKLTEVGSYLQRGAGVAQLVSHNLLELEADIPANRLAGLEPGREIEITFDDGTRHNAAVRAVVPEENPSTRTRVVRFNIDLGNSQGGFAIDQSVTLHIPAGVSREVTSVHKDAIIRRGPGAIVYVVEGGAAKLRPVTTGDAIGNRLEILTGVEPGDLAVVRGNERLRPDQPVEVGSQGTAS